jgi:hypothetical protein
MDTSTAVPPGGGVTPTPDTPEHGRGADPAVQRRIEEQFPALYLTLMSIIQGVALSYLVLTLDARLPRMSGLAWFQAAVSLVVLVIVWHEYALTAVTFVWRPTLLDTLLPFVIGCTEVVMAHNIGGAPMLWLGPNALVLGATLLAYLNLLWSAGRHPRNRSLLRGAGQPLWRDPSWLTALGTGAGALLCAALFGLARAGVLAPANPLGSVVVVLVVVGLGLRSTAYWPHLLG